jgi:hypothetical protein
LLALRTQLRGGDSQHRNCQQPIHIEAHCEDDSSPDPAKLKADAQKVVSIISSDKAKHMTGSRIKRLAWVLL